jgi:SEL1 protein
MPGEEDMYDDIIDDGILESFIIISLVAALLWLLYYRQQRQQQAHRRQEELARAQQAGQPAPVPQQQPQEADRGLFPPPGDPAFPEWVAGGIGH